MKLIDFIYERMKENNKSFTKQEWKVLEQNKELIKKVYLIGVINAKNL